MTTLPISRRFATSGSIAVALGLPNVTLAASTRQQAFATSTAALEVWHQANSGPTSPLTKKHSGLVQIASQRDADALSETLVTGGVQFMASGTARSPIVAKNFGVVGVAGVGTANSAFMPLVNYNGKNYITVQDADLDGSYERAYAGFGGPTYSQGILMQRVKIHRTGDDGGKLFKDSVFRNLYVTDLRPWNAAVDGAFQSGPNDSEFPHLDCLQGMRDGNQIIDCFLRNTTTETASSVVLIRPDVGENITSFVLSGTYLEGSNNYALQLVDQSGILGGAGNTLSGVVISGNLFSRIFGGSKSHATPVSAGSLYADQVKFQGNLWADDFLPVALPVMATR